MIVVGADDDRLSTARGARSGKERDHVPRVGRRHPHVGPQVGGRPADQRVANRLGHGAVHDAHGDGENGSRFGVQRRSSHPFGREQQDAGGVTAVGDGRLEVGIAARGNAVRIVGVSPFDDHDLVRYVEVREFVLGLTGPTEKVAAVDELALEVDAGGIADGHPV